jgi:hypothetical protein
VLKNGLAGMAHWGLFLDDFLGTSCLPKGLSYPQIRSINYVFCKGIQVITCGTVSKVNSKQQNSSTFYVLYLIDECTDWSSVLEYTGGTIALILILVLIVFGILKIVRKRLEKPVTRFLKIRDKILSLIFERTNCIWLGKSRG